MHEKQFEDPRDKPALEIEDQGSLSLIARGDNDWRVRRAAVLKLDDLSLLAEILHRDSLPAVRGAAYARLRILGHRVSFPWLESYS